MYKKDAILVHTPMQSGSVCRTLTTKHISLNYLSPLWSLAILFTRICMHWITCPTCTCTSLLRSCKSFNPLEYIIYWLFNTVKFTWIVLDRIYTWLATWTHRSLPKCEHRWTQSCHPVCCDTCAVITWTKVQSLPNLM